MRALAAATLLLYCLSLSGCATSTNSSMMDARAESPARPKTSGYPAVHDLPLKHEKPAITADEQAKLKKELIDARDRQSQVKAKESPARANPKKP